MGSKGSATTTTQTAPNPAAGAAYQDLLSRAYSTGNLPYTPYEGELTAPVNQQQQLGIGNINQNAGFAMPFIGGAANYAIQGATPISANDIAYYQNPYIQNVVGATEAQFQNMNAQQQQQVLGNAIAQNALGGDRTAVAQANLAGQQQLAQDPVIANLYSQGYDKAAQLALAGKQAQAQGAYSLGNLGVAGQNAALTGATAQIGAGTLEQQTQQALDQARLQQFLAQQGFPYQQTQWLAGIDTGVGSQMGGTSQTTAPKPSLLGQMLGLGTVAAGAAGQAGLFKPSTPSAAHGGAIEGFDIGGNVPFGAAVDNYVPSITITKGSGAPKPPTIPSSQSQSGMPSMGGLNTLGQGIGALFGGGSGAGAATTTGAGAEAAGSAAAGDAAIGEIGMGAGIADTAAASTAGAGIMDALPFAALLLRRGGAIRMPTPRAGFGTGGIVPRFAESGDVVYVPPEDMPQEVSQEAMDAWRRGTDADTARGMSAQPVGGFGPAGGGLAAADVAELPAEITRGTSRPSEDGSQALGYDSSDAQDAAYRAKLKELIAAKGTAGAPPQGQIAGFNIPAQSSNLWPSLMAAGFGMMSSRSPYPLSAIGEGGMSGLQTYEGLEKQQRAEVLSDKKMNLEVEKLAQSADMARKHLELQQTPFGWSRDAKGNLIPTAGGPQDPKFLAEKNAVTLNQQLAQHGYRMTPNGMEVIPGGPADPNVLRAASEAKGENWKPITMPDGSQMLYNTKTKEFVSPPALPNPNQPAPNTSSVPAQPGVPSLDGIIPANAALAAQPYNYSREAPYIEKGMDVPAPAPVAGKSTDSIKTDAEYYLQTGKLPPTRSGQSPIAVQQQNYRNAVQNYGNALAASRGTTPDQLADAWRSSPGMLRFILGADGRSTVSLGTAMRHLDTVKELATEWDKAIISGNWQTVRALQARVMREFGSDAGTGLEAAAQIMGPEIVKAIGIAGGGTEKDRGEATSLWRTASSLPQIMKAASVTQRLMLGQLQGKEQQAHAAGVSPEKFKGLIGAQEYERLKQIEGGGGGAPAAGATTGKPATVTQGGHTYTLQPDGTYK